MKPNIRFRFLDSFQCMELQILDTPNEQDLIEIQRTEFESIWVNYSDVSSLSNIVDSLSSVKFIRFYSDTRQDVSWISGLKNLKYLGLNGNLKGVVDFNQFKNIDKVFIDICKSTENIFDSDIRPSELGLYKYKGSLNDLPGNLHESVNILVLSSASMPTLEGLSKFKKLNMLIIERCLKLVDISELASHPELAHLSILGSNKIENYSPISSLKSLEEFTTTNKSLPTLKILNSSKIRFVELGEATKIEDLAIDVLLDFPSMRRAIYTKRKGYKMAAIEMKEILDKRV